MTDGQQSNKKKDVKRKNKRYSSSIHRLNKFNRRRKIIFVLLLMSTKHYLLIRKRMNMFSHHTVGNVYIQISNHMSIIWPQVTDEQKWREKVLITLHHLISYIYIQNSKHEKYVKFNQSIGFFLFLCKCTCSHLFKN